MTEQQQQSRGVQRRQARVTRDDGAPGVASDTTPDDGAVPAPHTVPVPGPDVATVQTATVRGAVAVTSLPVGREQVEAPDAAGQPGKVTVPTSAPSGAPAGSTFNHATVDLAGGKANEADPGPRLAYVVVWPKAAIHVRADAARTRTVGDGDDAAEERYLTVRSQVGVRDVVLAGQQVTLERGDVLPDEAAEGQGAFLASIGGAVAVSVPADAG